MLTLVYAKTSLFLWFLLVYFKDAAHSRLRESFFRDAGNFKIPGTVSSLLVLSRSPVPPDSQGVRYFPNRSNEIDVDPGVDLDWRITARHIHPVPVDPWSPGLQQKHQQMVAVPLDRPHLHSPLVDWL